MKELIYIFIKLIFIFFFPPLIIGIINKVKAVWAGKIGPSIFQPYFELIKLFKKQTIRSRSSSFLSYIAIVMQFITILFASFLVPFGKLSSLISFNGDFFLFIGLLGLVSLCQITIAMESAGAFQGMGASREINFSIFIEPALLIIFSSMIFYTKNYNLNKMFIHFAFTSLEKTMIGTLLGISFFLIMLIEGKRIPIDDPATHLELTMIHEAMILDLSGKDLLLVLYSSYLKIFIFASLVANIFISVNLPFNLSILIYILIILIISLIVGVIESIFPRVRMSHVPDFMLLVLSLSIIIIAVMFTMNT